MEDFTRNTQRRQEREMVALQFVSGDGSSALCLLLPARRPARNGFQILGSFYLYKYRQIVENTTHRVFLETPVWH
jgi:hypothetical protein